MRIVKNILNTVLKKKNYRLASIKPNGPTGVDLEYDLQLLFKDKSPVCLDVGANKGQTIDDLIQWLKAPTIHAFEPSSKIYQELTQRKQREGSKWSNISLYPIAFGDKQGAQHFYNYENSFLSSCLQLEDTNHNPFRGDIERVANTETVHMDTVDSFLNTMNISHIDLLKIDTQGFDLQVLKGAEHSIREGRIDYIFLEMNFVSMYENQGGATEIINYLEQLNQKVIGFYDVYRPLNKNNIAWCSTLFGGSLSKREHPE